MSSPHLIPLAVALDLLASCVAVQVDLDSLVYPRFPEPGSAEHDQDGGVCLILDTPYGAERFAAKDNATVRVLSAGDFLFTNTKGQPARLMPLLAAPYKAAPEPVHAMD